MEIRPNDPRVERLQHAHMPFVTIGRTTRPGSWSWVARRGAQGVEFCRADQEQPDPPDFAF